MYRGTGNGNAVLRREVDVVLRFGTSNLAVAILRSSDPAPQSAPIDAGSCTDLIACSNLRPRATLLAGIVSADVLAHDLAVSDFLAVRHGVTLKGDVAVRTALNSSAPPFLSMTSACDVGARVENLPLEIAASHRTTDAFFLCASGGEGTYEITAILEKDSPLDAGAPAATVSQSDAPRTLPIVMDLSALPTGYVAKRSASRYVVNTVLCGGTSMHARPDQVHVDGVIVTSTASDQLEFACEGVKTPQADTDSLADAGPDSETDCSHVTLSFAGGSCHLAVLDGGK